MRPDEFERLFADHAERLVSFLVYRTGDVALAEDVASTAFERAFKARARFDRRRASEKTWLYGIALNALADEHRRNGAEARALARAHSGPSRAAADPDPAETLGSRDELLTALAQLAPEERDAVALRFGGDLTAPQIATVLGVSLTTAEGRVYRGLRKLRELLG